MSAKAFVDTNVLVYAFDRSDPARHSTAVGALAEHLPTGVISAQVLSEFFEVTTRKIETPLPLEIACAVVRELTKLDVAPNDSPTLLDALDIVENEQISFWDALIVAAARRSGCDRIVSEDLGGGRVIAGLLVVDPFAA